MGTITVTTDPARRLVRARMEGMLGLADVQRFGREEQAAAAGMGVASGAFDLLIETHGNMVQTQAVMEAFGALIVHSPLKARRIATVRDGVLTRMQTRRMSRMRSGAEVFECLADAEAWLAS
ncbi:MAG: hypothetical protein ACRYFW_11400 [Janthinobacterium lividum]